MRAIRFVLFGWIAAASSWGMTGEWFFLPAGNAENRALAPVFCHPDTPLAPEGRYRWQAIPSFPHRVSLQETLPEAFYWYVASFQVPETWRDRGLLLDWGVIDDVDVTFVNGEEVGATGRTDNRHPPVWNVDRFYWAAPKTMQNRDEQRVAVMVKDWGGRGALGGFWGPPVVGVPLLKPGQRLWCRTGDIPPESAWQPDPDDDQWRFVFPAPENISETLGYLTLPPERKKTETIQSGTYWWYRALFSLPEDADKNDLVLDLGRINDVAACYVNGEKVGQIGHFPQEDASRPQPLLQTGARLRCRVPAAGLKSEGNILTVRVWSDRQSAGGWFGLPMIPIEYLSGIGDKTSAEPVGAPHSVDQALEWASIAVNNVFSETQTLPTSDISAPLPVDAPGVESGSGEREAKHEGLRQTERRRKLLTDIFTACDTAIERADQSPDLRQRALGLKTYALIRAGQTEAAWETFQELDFRRPIPAEAVFALSELPIAKENPEKGVVYGGEDRETQGDWPLRYGQDMAVLCAVNSPFDMVYGDRKALDYRLTIGSPVSEVARAWLGTPQTKERRAPFFPKTGQRRYASWDDRGEAQPFDDNGPDLMLTLTVPVGAMRLSFYFLDWDWADGQHPRRQSLILLDEEYRPLSIMDTGKFRDGAYKTFLVDGPRKLYVRLSKHRSPCVVLSGLFADRFQALSARPTQKRLGAGHEEKLPSPENRLDNTVKPSQNNNVGLYDDVSFSTVTSPTFGKTAEALATQAKERRDEKGMRLAAHALWLAGESTASLELIREMLNSPAGGDASESPEAKEQRKAQLERFVREGEREAYPAAWVADAARQLRKEWPDVDVEALLRRQTSKWALLLPEQP